jgi:hypothetical protein
MERGDSMSIVIKGVYADQGVTATDDGWGVYHVKGGDNTLTHTKDQTEADRFALAYAHGKLDGKRAERNRVKEDV